MSRNFRRRTVVRQARRERAWVHHEWDIASHPDGETAYFNVLSPEDYLEGDNPQKVDHCTLLRTCGRFELDVQVDALAEGFNSLQWNWMLIVVSAEAMENAAIVDPLLLEYSPWNPVVDSKGRIIRMGFNHVATQVIFNQLGAPMTTVFQPVMTGAKQDMAVEWDVKQKVKMKTDDTLWLAISATMTSTEATTWFTVGSSRTLFAD